MSVSRRSFLKCMAVLALQQALPNSSYANTAFPIEPPSQKDIATEGFDEVSKAYAIVSRLRRSIGQTKSKHITGTAVLLDTQGILASVAHISLPEEDQIKITFFPEAGGQSYELIANKIFRDQNIDISFWKLDRPDCIHSLDLLPIKTWGSITQQDIEYTRTAIAVGFSRNSLGNPIIHAGLLMMDGYQRRAVFDHAHENFCKVMALTVGKDVVLGGMSGGGVFSASGSFLGLINGGDDNFHASFTPSDAVAYAYSKLRGYPLTPLRNEECNTQSIILESHPR